MTLRKIKQATTIILLILAALFCIILLLLSFDNEKNISSWDNIYRSLGLKSEKALSDDFIRIIDVDQGDSILISSNGSNLLMDTGPPKSASILCSHLQSNNIEDIDALLLTHFHSDHIGGADKISERFSIDTLILPDFAKTDEDTEPVAVLRNRVLEDNGTVFTGVQGMCIDVGDFEITVLAYYKDLKTENARCMITMARYDDKKFLFMSDATKGAEKLLLKENLNLECDVIKIGHHGSGTSTSKELLEQSDPEYAVISCGLGNSFLHPHEDTVTLLEEAGIELYRTDLHGNVSFYITENGIEVVTQEKY